MLPVSQSGVKGSTVLKGEATTKAATIYRGHRTLFPGVEVNMLKEAGRSIASMGGAVKLDLLALLAGIFVDTLVFKGLLPAERTRKKKGIVWAPTHEAEQVLNRAFTQRFKGQGGVSYKIKPQERLPRDENGLVGFTYTLKTANVPLQAIWELIGELKLGQVLQDGFTFSLVDYDITVNVPGHIKAVISTDLESLYTESGIELVINPYQKSVGLQCPQWSSANLYFKGYNKGTEMLISTGIDQVGGSQLTNILKSSHKNIHKSFRDKNIQEKGFARFELRLNASSSPERLEDAIGMLLDLANKAAAHCLVSLSLDKMVSKYRAAGHSELLLIEEQAVEVGGGYKVVDIRHMDKTTGCFNSQSTAKVKQLPETLEAAVHLGYQWVSGDKPVVAVLVNTVGEVVRSVKLPATGRVAAIAWNSRADAETQATAGCARGISFSEVGMPSFWMDNPKKRIPVAVEDSSKWWAAGKDFELGAIESVAARLVKAREWAKVQNKQAKFLLEDLLAVKCPKGTEINKVKQVSLDAVKAKSLLVVEIAKNKHGDPIFLASDGATYKFNVSMVFAKLDTIQVSREAPAVFVRGVAAREKTKSGYLTYTAAAMFSWNAKAAKLVSKELAALFYTQEDYELYGDINM